MSKEFDLGPASTYAIAVAHGYQGTEEEWITEQEENRVATEQAAKQVEEALGTMRDIADQVAKDATNSAANAESALDSRKKSEAAANRAEGAAGQAVEHAAQAEKSRDAAETAEEKAKESLQNAVAARDSAKQSERAAADSEREARDAKNTAVAAKDEAVSMAQAAGNAARGSGEARDAAMGAAGEAGENAKKAKEAAETAESEREKTEGFAKNAETAKDGAEKANDLAQNAREEAKAAAGNAVRSAKEAEDNADSAGNAAKQAAEIVDVIRKECSHDTIFRLLVLKAKSTEEVDTLFKAWWEGAWPICQDKKALLTRWFGDVLKDDRIHGVKLPLFATSSSPSGELTDDSVGLVCEPSTASVAGRDDFAYLPQFWTLEVAMERNADGTHEIIKVEHIDSLEDIRSGKYGLCQVLQKNTFTREWKDESYHYMQMCCDPEDKTGWNTWPQGTGKDGAVYAYMANPKYCGGLDENGIPTCGTNLPPMNYTSHNVGVSLWRKRGAQYSGAAGNLLKWQLAMIWLKYARKGNSGTIEGCSSYYIQYTAAVSETGVERIILTNANAVNILDGSTIILGNKGDGTSTDRGTASMFSICKNKQIKSIEKVTIGETEYTAINIDNGGILFDTVADETYISTMPYCSGWNDGVLGYDGSRFNFTNGKEPGLIQRTEFQNGAYLILSDELWQWGMDADGNFTFDCFTSHDQSKVTTNGTISGDYTKQDDLTMTFPADTAGGWKYIEDIAICNDRGFLWPSAVGTAAGSGTGVKAGFYVSPAASGVRAAWCCGYLYSGGIAGLAARNSYGGTTDSSWAGAVGCPSGISG